MRRIARVLDGIWLVEGTWPGLWRSLAIGATGAFALWQYASLLDDRATTHTMEYIKRYEDGRVADARQDISSKLRNYADQFNRMELSPGQHAIVLNTLFEQEPKLYDDIDTIVDFFEGLQTCVREEVCSRDVAMGYFGAAEALQFWRNFKPYVDERRLNNRDFAKGLEWFATQGRQAGERKAQTPANR